MIGIVVTDCWKAHRYHVDDKEFTLCEFADSLAVELVENTFPNGVEGAPSLSPLPVDRSNLQQPRRTSPRRALLIDRSNNTGNLVSENENVSPLTNDRTYSSTSKKARHELLWIRFEDEHPHTKNEVLDYCGKTRRRKCKMCQRKTAWYCQRCRVFVCKDDQGHKDLKCYRKHIIEYHPDVGLTL
jgi:hypothetical protein